MYKITHWLHEQVYLENVLSCDILLRRQVLFTSNQMLCLSVRLTSVFSNVKFLLCFQQTVAGALLTPEDEGVLITSLVKKLQKKNTLGFLYIAGRCVVYCLGDLFS